ncbi:MAG: DUF1800 domain-containing protein [Pseudomonadota bacterium]
MTVSRATNAAIRFGYGFHPDQSAPRGPEDLLLSLDRAAAAPLLFPVTPRAERREHVAELFRLRRAKASQDDVRAQRKKLRQMTIRDGAQSLYQRALSPHGFFERLVGFWTDHFAVGAKNAGQGVLIPDFEPTALRPHLLGSFGDLLVAVVQHPAMLSYLDQVESVGPNSRMGKRTGKGLNENLAREVLELHTMGVSAAYTQEDVRGLAGLLTGYGVDRRKLAFGFFDRRAEPGSHRILGRTYGGRPSKTHAETFLRELAEHPDTARHIARKLAVHFVADTPDPGHVAHIERTWVRNRGNLPAVYQALVEHQAAWGPFGQKVKRPQDLLISTLRAIALMPDRAREMGMRGNLRIAKALRNLNQPLYRPPGPQGWPEEAEAWITPQGLAGRLEFAGQVGQLLAKRSALDPRRFAETMLRDALRPSTAFAVGAAPDRWEGLALALASPEFNRR